MPDLLDIFLIFLAFAFVHSITVSRWFKDRCKEQFGETFLRVWYRFLYTCISIATVAAAFALIRKVPDQVLWQGPAWFRWAVHAVQFAAVLFGVRAFEHSDAAEFLGVGQVWRYLLHGEVSGDAEGLSERGLVTTGVYGIVRHPMYLAGIVIFTFEPNITRNGMLITVLADLYFLFGALIEDRRFAAVYGEEYRHYRERVPLLLPVIRKRT